MLMLPGFAPRLGKAQIKHGAIPLWAVTHLRESSWSWDPWPSHYIKLLCRSTFPMIFSVNSCTQEALESNIFLCRWRIKPTFSWPTSQDHMPLVSRLGGICWAKYPTVAQSLVCCIDDDLIASQCDKSVCHLFALAASSTYGEAAGTLNLPCWWNSRFLFHHHAPHVSSSKGYRR